MCRSLVLAAVIAIVAALFGSSDAPARAPRPDAAPAQVAAPPGTVCVDEESGDEEGSDDEGEEDEDAPPKFSAAFYARRLTLDASLDGLEGRALPISIEEVCGVPRTLVEEAGQLAGADGVALLLPRTEIWQGRTRLQGERATAAVANADTATLRVRLTRPKSWRKDDDGDAVATFRTGRIDITD